MASNFRFNLWRLALASSLFVSAGTLALTREAAAQAPATQAQPQAGRPSNRPGNPPGRLRKPTGKTRQTDCRKTWTTHDSTGSGSGSAPNSGAPRLSAAATWTGTSTGRTAASVWVEARRSRSNAALLSAEFRLYQSKPPADFHYRWVYSVWRSRIFPPRAAGAVRIYAASATRLRYGIFRWICSGVRPSVVHGLKRDGLAGLKSLASLARG